MAPSPSRFEQGHCDDGRAEEEEEARQKAVRRVVHGGLWRGVSEGGPAKVGWPGALGYGGSSWWQRTGSKRSRPIASRTRRRRSRTMTCSARTPPSAKPWSAMARAGPRPTRRRLGRRLGRAETLALGADANRFAPRLEAFDRFGRRRDEVDYHPAYHAMMAMGLSGRHPCPALGDGAAGRPCRPRRARIHADPGRARRVLPDHHDLCGRAGAAPGAGLAAEWEPLILSRAYDPAPVPAAEKGAATIGMAMTEKQGGSDVRANTTRAESRPATGSTSSSATNGSARHRCRTPS